MAKHDYTVDEFVDILLETPNDKLAESLVNDPDLLDALLLYSSLEQNKLVKYVNDAPENLRFDLLAKIIALYPVTTNLVKALIQNNKQILEDVDHFVKWFDSSEVMIKCFRKYMQLFHNCNQQNQISNLEKMIEDLQKKKLSLKSQIDTIKNMKSNQDQLHKEVSELQKEFEQLNEEWSEDSLRNKKQNLEKDIKKLKDVQEDQEQRLNLMKKHFESLSNVKNKRFEKALEKFGDVLETLSEDEGEV